jgi:hypothetical protein
MCRQVSVLQPGRLLSYGRQPSALRRTDQTFASKITYFTPIAAAFARTYSAIRQPSALPASDL